MTINGIEIITQDSISLEELTAYVNRAKESYGNHLYQMHIRLNGEHVEIYSFLHGKLFERIIRKPRLTEKQVRMFQALHTLGYRFITKDLDGYVYARNIKPEKCGKSWGASRANGVTLCEDTGTGCLHTLMSWNDPEPLDIVQTLKENEIEIEEEPHE